MSCVDRGASCSERSEQEHKASLGGYDPNRSIGCLSGFETESINTCAMPPLSNANNCGGTFDRNNPLFERLRVPCQFQSDVGEGIQSRAIPTAMPGFPRRQFVIRFVSSKDDGHVASAVVAWSDVYALRLPTSVPTMPLALDPHCMYLQCCPCPQLLQSLAPTVHR